jgi:maltose O-acetyltransferase
MMSEMKRRMESGELYRPDAELGRDHDRALLLVERYNSAPPDDQDALDAILAELLGEVGEGVVVKQPFRCDYGFRIAIGARTFVNFDCVMLDGASITIGSSCQLAPRVQLVTATHPLDPQGRRAGWESVAPISVGDNVWLGAGAIVCPGVEIGADTVVGAGAVVVRDLPVGVLAGGVPARILRELGESS